MNEYEDDEIDMARLDALLNREGYNQSQKEVVYEIISQPDQTENYRQLLCILCNDEELVGIMVRNSNLLGAMRSCRELNVENMLQILTAGEEDGRKSNPTVFEEGCQTEEQFHSTDSLLMKDEQLDEITQKVEDLEIEIERLKTENINNEAKAQKEIEKYKKD